MKGKWTVSIQVKRDMANIEVIDYDESTGRLREIYDGLIGSRGKLADVHKIQSLRPESIVKHIDLYLEIMFSKSELSRAEREIMAIIVSVANSCDYCQLHHAIALNHYWKNQDKIDQLKRDFRQLDLDERTSELCVFAETLTKNPGKANDKLLIDPLRKIGLSDSAILDASLVISYFNFVNRLVLSMGVKPNQEEVSGYKY